MKLSRLFASFALVNPFAVKVVAEGNVLSAHRNVFGFKVALKGAAESRAIVDFVVGLTKGTSGIDKSTISGPLGFVKPRQGDLLHLLLQPTKAPAASFAKKEEALPALMSAKLYDKRPQNQRLGYVSAVDKRLIALARERVAARVPTLRVTNPDVAAPYVHVFTCKMDELD